MKAKAKPLPHTWTRPPLTVFLLVCGICGTRWEPSGFEPTNPCRAPKKERTA